MSNPCVADVIEQLSRRFDEAGLSFGHGTDNAWDEATALVLAVTGAADHVDSLRLILTPAQLSQVNALADRRISERIPLAYLLGKATFAGLEFLVEPGIVIPRSPIAELISNAFSPWLLQAPERIIDLCCGSGCIGIAAALQFPDSTLTLVDIDGQATDLAARNVQQHKLADRARILTGDLWAAVPEGRFDLILSNPPYVDAADMSVLPAEYQHEPELGLAAGEDGLDVVKRILAPLPERLAARGLLVCEVGNSAAALQRAFLQTPFVWPELASGGEGVFLLSGEDVQTLRS